MKRFLMPLVAVVVLSFYSCNKCSECTIKDAKGNSLLMVDACGDDPESKAIDDYCSSPGVECPEKEKMTVDCKANN